MVAWWLIHGHPAPHPGGHRGSGYRPLPAPPIRFRANQLKQQQGLPFLKLLSRALVEDACRHCNHPWRERIYTPWITLGLFLSQVLSDDHSCDDAVERFQKFRYDQGLPAVAPETTSYCEARRRLPEELTWDLVRRTGQAIQRQAEDAWLFHGRAVKIIDGSTVTMPDTPENQAAYPQPKTQAPGLGFPIARLLVVFSLAVGTVLQAALGPYQGKQTGELALLRQVLDQFRPGDIVLADRFFCSYWMIAALQARGVDVVVRLHQARTADFRRGRRLGREDHLVTWTKPAHVPDWMSRAEYDAMPARIDGPRAARPGPGSDQAGPRPGHRHDAGGCEDLPGRGAAGACSASGGTRNWICAR